MANFEILNQLIDTVETVEPVTHLDFYVVHHGFDVDEVLRHASPEVELDRSTVEACIDTIYDEATRGNKMAEYLIHSAAQNLLIDSGSSAHAFPDKNYTVDGEYLDELSAQIDTSESVISPGSVALEQVFTDIFPYGDTDSELPADESAA